MMLLAACGTNNEESLMMRETLTAYPTQSAALLQALQVERTQAVATIQSSEQQAQRFQEYNAIVLATVRANQVPTPEERVAIVEGGAMSLEMLNTSDGQMRLMQIGMAGYIKPEDNCFETHQQYYTLSNTSVIYMTAVAVNLKAGTRFDVNWEYERQRVFQSSWTAPQDADIRCVAVPMRAGDTALQTGNWTATLFMNGMAQTSSSFQIQN